MTADVPRDRDETREHWDALADWATSWLSADDNERARLRADLAFRQPALVAVAEALIAPSRELRGFLETPAIVLAAVDLAVHDDQLPAGTMIGPYQVVSFIARGGMGDVYRATDARLGRDVAVKLLAETKTGDPQRVARFMHEARVTASLDHPNIVRVFDVGRTAARAYLVAELLQGETLRQRIERGALPIEEVVRIALEIAAGLGAAHAAGLVHRDLKPDNVFLTYAGTTKLLDFGIAKLAQDEHVRDGFSTLTGVVLGTAGYLAPEQIRGMVIDARADLFALGAVLFEMIAGARAFAREHIVETLHAILHDAPPDLRIIRPETPAALVAVVERLLQTAPEARFASSRDVIRALATLDLTPGLPTFGTMLEVTARDHRQPPAVILAVMPCRSIPSGSGNDFLEIGLADVFISRLSQLANVRVLPLTATERLRGEDPRDAARHLRANRVLVVTLQRDSGLVRAGVHLLAVDDDRTIWATTVDTDASSVFSIQDIIVTRVIEELAPHLETGLRARLARPGTRNNEAFETYLRARACVAKPTPRDLELAADLFLEALRLDASYADAWAGLGSAYKRMPIVSASAPEVLVRAREAADRALALEPDHAEAHSVLGTVAFWYDWDYARAEAVLRRSLELQPSATDTLVFLAHLFSNLGRADEAIEEIRRARALDPLWLVPRALEGQFLFMARRYDEALRHLEEMLKIAPAFGPARFFHTWALEAVGRFDDALVACDAILASDRGPEGSGFGPLALKGYVLARIGRGAEAQTALEMLRRTRQSAALVLHGLGRDAEAIQDLAEAADARSVAVTFLGVDPRWDTLRGRSDFDALVARVNLLDVSNRFRR
jgi:serine/threonine-protein kinase